MIMIGITNAITHSLKSGLNISNWIKRSCFSTFTLPLFIQISPVLMAEPMKKKKKMDPAIVKLRKERKRKKLWRDCKRLMKLEKQLKPIDEIEIPYKLVDDRPKYLREKVTLNVEELENRADLFREWASYKTKQHTRDLQMIDRIDFAQERALNQLLKVSPELYTKAVQIDETFLPFTAKGTTWTPPIKNYDSPDGEYIDVSKTWEAPKIPELNEKKKVKYKKK